MEERIDTAPPLYAGLFHRLAAFMVDALIIALPWMHFSSVLSRNEQSTTALHAAMFAAAWVYNAGLHASPWQATFGKVCFRLKLTNLRGERVSLARATARFLAAWPSALLLMAGFFAIAYSTTQQAVHDRWAGTLVVRSDATPDDVVRGGGVLATTSGVSYTWFPAFVALVLVWVGEFAGSVYHSMGIRSRVSGALVTAHAAKPRVEQLIAEGRLPAAGATLALHSDSPHVESMQVDGMGRISLALKGLVPSANGRIEFTPAVDKSGKITWTCTSRSVRKNFLPGNCRD
jgi:uncharacterized RDD family membrane protein YckC